MTDTHTILGNLRHAALNGKNVTIGGGLFKPSEIKAFVDLYKTHMVDRGKGWTLAASLQAQVDILLPVVKNVADDDDEYGFGPGARKALDALAARAALAT